MRYYIIGETKSCDNNQILHNLEIRNCLKEKGHDVVNQKTLDYIGAGISERDTLRFRLSLIDMCDAVYVLMGWKNVEFSDIELLYAKSMGKEIHFESKQWLHRKSMMKSEGE